MSAKDTAGAQRPLFPEEASPLGHDGEPEPDAAIRSSVTRRVRIETEPASPPAPAASQEAVDTAFLVKGFAIPPAQSTRLVRDGRDTGDAAAIESEARRLMAQDDPLADVPSPQEPQNDLVADTDEERLKPVVRTNRRGGASRRTGDL